MEKKLKIIVYIIKKNERKGSKMLNVKYLYKYIPNTIFPELTENII